MKDEKVQRFKRDSEDVRDTHQRISTHVHTRFPEPTADYDDTFSTVESSCEEVKRIINWLEYVAENEYTPF